MVIENEPLYIDLKEFASNHSLDFSEWAEGNLDNSSYSMYITIRSDGEKVANVTFRKINVPAKGGSIPGQKRKKMDLKKNEIKESSNEWTLE